MKIMLLVPTCYAIAGCLLLAGCVKDPTSPNNPKPKWLLEKISITDGYRDPNDGEIYVKSVLEYSYRNNKPWRRVQYYGKNDTINLDVTSIDSFYYDQQGRVKEMSKYSAILQKHMYVKKYTYNGNDKLPVREEITGNYNGGPYNTYINRFIYSDTVILQISDNKKDGFDTLTFTFDIRGNFVSMRYPTGPRYALYSQYDNTPNPARFFNVENALPFEFESYNGSSRFSQNNWTVASRSIGSFGGLFDGPCTITLNAQGLVEKTAIPHGYTVPERYYYKTYYQYRRAE